MSLLLTVANLVLVDFCGCENVDALAFSLRALSLQVSLKDVTHPCGDLLLVPEASSMDTDIVIAGNAQNLQSLKMLLEQRQNLKLKHFYVDLVP
jgi:hypothetical protein